jgi:hypothetical protein
MQRSHIPGSEGRRFASRETASLENTADIAGITGTCMPSIAGKVRLRTLKAMDGRTIGARRARELAKGFAAELGGTIAATQRLAIERAAQLVALSENARVRRLAGDQTVTLEDVVRVDNAAGRAVRALGIKPGAGPKRQTLAEYVAARQARPPVASPAPAPAAAEPPR